ncbi:MAG: YhjD/YihY/BrkB family envelope integrity protein [Candidatus Omnitrophota bacterium]
MIGKVLNFIKTDIWRIPIKSLPPAKSFFIKQLRIVLVALRGFDEDKCNLRASALTFYSLLSIVPVAAMAFGIAKGFGFDRLLEQQLIEKGQGYEEIVTNVITFAQSLLNNTKGGAIAGVGVAILFWTIMKVLGNIEISFNEIWGIKKNRSIGRKFSDYTSIMLLCPVLLIMSSSLTVFITSQIKLITEKISLLGAVSPLIFFALKLLPYCTLWFLFTFIYIFMPNTKVDFKSGIFAGIIAGTIYQIVQWAYIAFQIGAAKYNAIYGSFAALPLFLLWLQVSWLVVLFGAEISFACQNVDTYEFESDCLNISYSYKKLITLQIAHALIIAFHKGEKALTATDISKRLEVPIRLVRQILFELIQSGIVSEVKPEENRVIAYQPARDIGELTIENIISNLEHHGSFDIPVSKTEGFKKISESLKIFSDTIRSSSANLALKDI